jgi:ABC-type dipeptide/oligopeptide/nickel transport system permease component
VTFLGGVLSQMFAARSGLGYVLVQSVSLHDMPRLYGLVLLLTLFAFAVVVLGAAVLAWLLTGDPRWRRIAWTVFKYAVFALLGILLLFAGEALLK